MLLLLIRTPSIYQLSDSQPPHKLLQLLDAKHPTAWVEFEKGDISEEELFLKFFKDGRPFDTDGLITALIHAYDYIDGMEDLLKRLSLSGHEIHSFSNYPSWYRYIEKKLGLTEYLSWTYISCEGPMKGLRKPNIECYRAVIDHIQRDPAVDIIFIDDRLANIDAAIDAGIVNAVHFQGDVELLERTLKTRGLEF